MKIPDKIYLDVDDVLNCCTLSVLRYLGCPIDSEDYSAYKPEWGYDVQKAACELLPGLRLSKYDFWNRFPREFWATITVSPECNKLIRICATLVGKKNVFLLTKPSGHGDCAAGKIDWINTRLPMWIRDQFLIGAPKYCCASPDSLLIDDDPRNVKNFRKNKGQAILFPRPWNSNHQELPMSFVSDRLAGIFETNQKAS